MERVAIERAVIVYASNIADLTAHLENGWKVKMISGAAAGASYSITVAFLVILEKTDV